MLTSLRDERTPRCSLRCSSHCSNHAKVLRPNVGALISWEVLFIFKKIPMLKGCFLDLPPFDKSNLKWRLSALPELSVLLCSSNVIDIGRKRRHDSDNSMRTLGRGLYPVRNASLPYQISASLAPASRDGIDGQWSSVCQDQYRSGRSKTTRLLLPLTIGTVEVQAFDVL